MSGHTVVQLAYPCICEFIPSRSIYRTLLFVTLSVTWHRNKIARGRLCKEITSLIFSQKSLLQYLHKFPYHCKRWLLPRFPSFASLFFVQPLWLHFLHVLPKTHSSILNVVFAAPSNCEGCPQILVTSLSYLIPLPAEMSFCPKMISPPSQVASLLPVPRLRVTFHILFQCCVHVCHP